ncbi:hypothetical protein CSIV_12460 [Microbacterium sp. CSI-V]|nr:helix-turn-helix domain-containing protein [Microbacterium sp. TL13]ONI62322.1 hypothetical protein CSIV_12460 [Microbacterium sp. CSI-V]
MTHLNNSDRLLTPTDAAAYLGRSVAALAQLRYRGTGPTYIRAGGRIRYRESAIQAWLDEGERDAT